MDFKPDKEKIKTNGASGKKKKFFTWDHRRGDIEIFDRNGKHLGSIPLKTGDMINLPVKGRLIKKDL